MSVPGHAISTTGGRRVLTYVAGALAAVALVLWDEALLVAPILGLTNLVGAGLTFLCLAPVFFVVSFTLALLAVRAYERASAGQPNGLERWLRRQAESSTGRFGQRLLRATAWLGFVVSSVLIGGILTTWLIRVGGRRHGFVPVAAGSSALFAVGFVGMYTGLFGLVFG